MAGTRNSHLGIEVNCASSDMDSSDFLSLRLPLLSVVETYFGDHLGQGAVALTVHLLII